MNHPRLPILKVSIARGYGAEIYGPTLQGLKLLDKKASGGSLPGTKPAPTRESQNEISGG